MDEDTLTTDTLSPESPDSSHSTDSQVRQVLLQPTLPTIPQLTCLSVGAGAPAGGAAAPRGTEEPGPNHRPAQPAAGLYLTDLRSADVPSRTD